MKSKRDRSSAHYLAPALLTITIFLVSAPLLMGQSDPPKDQPKPKTETEQLRERLQLLEATVTELKDQLTALETAKQNPEPAVIEATYTTGETTSKKIVPVSPARNQDDKGDSKFEIYGFAMLDAGYQFKSNHPDWFDTLRVTQLPSFDRQYAPNGKTYWGVRQSRLGFKSSTPTKYGELKTVFEFELFGTGVDAGQTTFRLRHAYGELGQFGAGQYWTVFGDTDTFPNSFEYWGPPGLIWYRNVGVRWMPLKGKNSVTIGLERPGASSDNGVVRDRIELEGVKPRFTMPDITGNFRMQRDWGHVQFGGMLRKISWVDTNDDDIDLSDTVWGYGGAVTSALKFGENDTGRFSFVYGTGIQNYFNDAPVDVGVEVLTEINPLRGGTPSIRGVTLPILGLSAFLDHRWNKSFTTAAGWSMINIENSNGQLGDAFKRGHYALANLAYYPVSNVMIGGEFQYGRRENFFDGYKSEDFRIQFAFKYNFSKEFKFQ